MQRDPMTNLPDEAQDDSGLSPEERRRHQRVDLTIKARVLKEDGVEEPCLIVNISAGGALLKAVNPPPAGEKVVLYIDDMGRFEGQVIRSAKHFFAVDYRGRRAKARRRCVYRVRCWSPGEYRFFLARSKATANPWSFSNPWASTRSGCPRRRQPSSCARRTVWESG